MGAVGPEVEGFVDASFNQTSAGNKGTSNATTGERISAHRSHVFASSAVGALQCRVPFVVNAARRRSFGSEHHP